MSRSAPQLECRIDWNKVNTLDDIKKILQQAHARPNIFSPFVDGIEPYLTWVGPDGDRFASFDYKPDLSVRPSNATCTAAELMAVSRLCDACDRLARNGENCCVIPNDYQIDLDIWLPGGVESEAPLNRCQTLLARLGYTVNRVEQDWAVTRVLVSW